MLSDSAWTFSKILPAPIFITILCLAISIGEINTSLGFLISSAILVIIFFLSRLLRIKPESFSFLNQAAALVILWITLCFSASLPFYFLGSEYSFFDFHSSFFESVSGYTSTGLTMVLSPSQLPSSIQLFRSLLQWIGGAGFVIFVLGAIGYDDKIRPLIKASGVSTHALLKGKRLLKSYLYVYILLTIIAFVGYAFLGRPWWEALNHSLTTSATGGFTITDGSFSTYTDGIILFSGSILILSTLPFPVFFMMWKERKVDYLFTTQVKLYFVWILFFCLFLGFTSSFNVATTFNTVSAIATAGFSAEPISADNKIPLFTVTILMLIGACSSSTAGGIKMSRIAWLLKGISKHLFNGSRFSNNNESVEKKNEKEWIILSAAFFSFTLLLHLAGAWAISYYENRELSSIIAFDTASAIGTTGLSSGFVSANMSPISKWIMSFLMLIGRLEFILIIIVAAKNFNKKV